MSSDFKHIITENNGILYKVAKSFSIVEEDFEDLYQEILIQVWNALPNFRNQSKLSTWIYKVALNTSIRYSSKLKARNDSTVELTSIHNKVSIEREEESKEKKIEGLYKAIQTLKKNEKAIILLYLEQTPYEEIAEIIGISVSNVGVKINRIKSKLLKKLKSVDHE